MNKTIRNGLVSVIVPAYNAESTITRCLNSISKQSYSNLEILIVDDGSKDQTARICEELAKKDSRIHLLSIKNGGVAHARNVGMQAARGEWIAFADADDWMKSDFVQKAVSAHQKYGCDTYCFNNFKVKNTTIEESSPIRPSSKVYCQDEIELLMNSLYIPQKNMNSGELFRAVWGKVLSASIIRQNSLQFPENIRIGEDALFLLDYLARTRKVYIEDEAEYYYLVSNESATRSFRENYEQTIMDEYREMMSRFQQYGLNDQEASVYFWRVAVQNYMRNQLFKTSNALNAANSLKKYLSHIDEKKYLKILKNGDSFRTKIKVILCQFGWYRLMGLFMAVSIKANGFERTAERRSTQESR